MKSARTRRITIGAAVTALVVSLLPATATASRPVTAPAVVTRAPTPGSPSGGDPYFPLYGNGGYDVLHYGLKVRYNPKSDVLKGTATLTARATQSLSRFNLDLVGLTVHSVKINRRSARWKRSAGHELTITPKHALANHHRFTVVVRYSGKPRTFSDPSLGTYGFLKTSDGAIAVGEPEVAAYWYPVNDHPQDKATYRIRLTVPRGLRAISNGLPSKTHTTKHWATTSWTEHHRMASYLAFMAVGHFSVHRWHTKSGLPVIDAVDPQLSSTLRKRIGASFSHQGEIIATESHWFGRYPFESVGGVVDKVNVGFALENQTRPTYSPDFWTDDDSRYDDFVVVHELAHQWYGDSVSLRRWRDIWLNEGFATYAEWLWAQKKLSTTPQDFFDAYASIPADDPFWQVPPGNPGRRAVFDEAVYDRGALTLQALRQRVGTKVFFQILQAWPREHRYGNGTTAQFIALAERLSGRQLDSLFTTWLYTAGKPAGLTPSTASANGRTSSERAAVTRWRSSLKERLSHSGRR